MTENKSVGRPLTYDEETKVISFRVPLSAIKEIKESVSNQLEKLRVCSFFSRKKINSMKSQNVVFTSIGEVEDNLVRDNRVSQFLLDTIVNECIAIEERGNNFNLISTDNSVLGDKSGYILDEFENMEDEPIEVTTYLFEDYD